MMPKSTVLGRSFFLVVLLASLSAGGVEAQDVRFVRGDVNVDGRIDITDPIVLLGYQFLGGEVPPCLDAADANDDAVSDVDITDAIHLLAFLFLAGPPPAPPTSGMATYDASNCGTDPSADQLGCASFGSCPQGPPPSQAPPPPAVDPLPRLTRERNIQVSGTTARDTMVEVTGGAETVTVSSTDGAFDITVPLTPNRLNRLFVTAIVFQANKAVRSAPQPVEVTEDETPPNLAIDFPAGGASLTLETITVAGRVSDLLSGFMGLTVTVNGLPAAVDIGIGTNGTFERGAMPLALGENVLTARATDATGNQSTRSVTITRLPAEGARLDVVAGDLQTGPIHTDLPQPLRVLVLKADGTPFPGKDVVFRVIRSDGLLFLRAGGPGARSVTARSSEDGQVVCGYRLGTDAGCGNNRVEVTSEGIAGAVFFCASATPGPAAQINIGSGNNQRAETRGPAPQPLRIWISDGCNGVAAVDVAEPVDMLPASGSATVVTAWRASKSSSRSPVAAAR